VKYSKYPSYKDSGVEWLGEVPEHWELWKTRHAFSTIGSGTTPASNNDSYYSGDTAWVTTGELRENLITSTKKLLTTRAIREYTALTIFPENSVVIAMYGATIGRLGILGVKATTNQACCVITNSKIINNDYLYYWLMGCRNEIISLANGGGQPNISQDTIASLKISTPKIQEQKAITNFLDKKTAKIETLIQKQSKLIELLKEKRQAVISHAVTKGLNSNVPMKNSGVEWLGDIPEHWELGLLSVLFDNNKVKNTGMLNNNLLSLSYGKIIKKNIETTFGLLPESFETYQIVKPGYIILRLTDLQNDKKSLRTGLVTQEGIITSAYVGLKKKSKSIGNESFIHYYLHTFDIFKGFYGMGSGVRQSLIFDELKKLKIVLPPLAEQDTIVKFINDTILRIDNLISKSEKSIELLKGKRTALISATVTGKIDVRESA